MAMSVVAELARIAASTLAVQDPVMGALGAAIVVGSAATSDASAGSSALAFPHNINPFRPFRLQVVHQSSFPKKSLPVSPKKNYFFSA